MAELEVLALRVQLAAFPGATLAREASALLSAGLGGVCLFGSNTTDGPDAVRRLTDAVHQANDQAVVAIDEEGGDVTRLHVSTGSPSPGNAALGVVDDLTVTEEAARAIGTELAGLGIDLDLAPVADVNSDPANPVIGVRSFGAGPDVAARHVAAWVRGLQAQGVSASAKHFPGHGDTAMDSHSSLPRIDVPAQVLRERELVPFAAAVDAGVDSVMTSHIVVPALDPTYAVTFSPAVLAVLREELGFDGVVVTDALDMAGATGDGRGIPRAAVQALAAGADLLCLGPDKDPALIRAVQSAVVSAVRTGGLPEQRLVEAAGRVRGLSRSRDHRRDGDRADGADVAPPTGEPEHTAVAAAARALRVEGVLPVLTDAVVVRIDTEPTIAAGRVRWGLDADLVLGPDDRAAAERLVRSSRGRPVVLQVRDLHRHPGPAAIVRRVLEVAEDRTGQPTVPVVLVEWGWPAPSPLLATGATEPTARRPTRVLTHGASWASRVAVEQLFRDSAGWKA